MVMSKLKGKELELLIAILPYNNGSLYGMCEFPIMAICTILMDRAGRRPLLFVSASRLFVGCVITAISFYMKIFPINIEVTAGSFVTLINWFGSWIITFAFSYLMIWSSYGKGTHIGQRDNTGTYMTDGLRIKLGKTKAATGDVQD